MSDGQRDQLLKALRLVFGDNVDEPGVEELEARLISFYELCGKPYGCTSGTILTDYPMPHAGDKLTFPLRKESGELNLFALRLLREYGGFGIQDAFAAACGYENTRDLSVKSDGGDERALAVLGVSHYYMLRPIYLYLVLRMSEKIEEALKELTREAVGAVRLHVLPHWLVPPGPDDPPLSEPSSWAEDLRASGTQKSGERLRLFAIPKILPRNAETIVRESVKKLREGLEKDLGRELYGKDFSERVSRDGLALRAHVTNSVFTRLLAKTRWKSMKGLKEALTENRFDND